MARLYSTKDAPAGSAVFVVSLTSRAGHCTVHEMTGRRRESGAERNRGRTTRNHEMSSPRCFRVEATVEGTGLMCNDGKVKRPVILAQGRKTANLAPSFSSKRNITPSPPLDQSSVFHSAAHKETSAQFPTQTKRTIPLPTNSHAFQAFQQSYDVRFSPQEFICYMSFYSGQTAGRPAGHTEV